MTPPFVLLPFRRLKLPHGAIDVDCMHAEMARPRGSLRRGVLCCAAAAAFSAAAAVARGPRSLLDSLADSDPRPWQFAGDDGPAAPLSRSTAERAGRTGESGGPLRIFFINDIEGVDAVTTSYLIDDVMPAAARTLARSIRVRLRSGSIAWRCTTCIAVMHRSHVIHRKGSTGLTDTAHQSLTKGLECETCVG